MKIINGADKPINIQMSLFRKILFKNKTLFGVLKTLDEIGIKDYYVVAGAINQTVFNYLHGYPIENGIKDYDIVYFDNDTSFEAEDKIINAIKSKLSGYNIELDIKNEARVHLWYEQKFGRIIEPNLSVEDAINKWCCSTQCIGVRLQKSKLICYAPYGLNDLFNMIIRPIKGNFTKELYDEKTKKWKSKWPLLTIIPWEE